MVCRRLSATALVLALAFGGTVFAAGAEIGRAHV